MSNVSLQSFIIDAFTTKAFSGNPAAVCILNESKSDEYLQSIAAEFNLSETAFIQCSTENHWHLRWFSPTCEIQLCGHATLAAAHVLLHEFQLPYDSIIFSTLSGNLKATIYDSGIKLDFPRIHCFPLDEQIPTITALGLNQSGAYYAGEDIILELENEHAVLDYQPDLFAISQLDVRGIIITAQSSTTDRDFVSRFFAPNVGIIEDPVTGSANCSLASLWSLRLGKHTLRAEQLSYRRGIVDMVVHKDRIDLIGECVTILRGQLANNFI